MSQQQVSKKSKKNTRDMDENVDHSKSSAIFRIKPNGQNQAIIKYAGYITDTQNLGDEIVELDTIIHHDSDVYGKHAIPIQPIEKYEFIRA